MKKSFCIFVIGWLMVSTISAQIIPVAEKTITGQLSGDYNRGGAISADGSVFAIGGKGGQLKLFNGYDGSLKRALDGHSSWVNGLAFSRDGRFLASACSDKTVKIWDVQGGYALRTIYDFSSDVIAVAFSSDGRYVAAGGFDKTVKIIEAATGTVIRTLYGHNNSVWSLQFSPDGRYLLSGDSDGKIIQWAVSSWYIEKAATQSGWITSIRFTSDGQKAITTSEGGTVRIWSFPSMTEIKTMSHDGGVWMAAVSPDNQMIASGGKDKKLRLWNASNGSEIASTTGHTANVSVVLFSADGKKIITASDDNTIILWNLGGSGQWASGGVSSGSVNATLQRTISNQLSGDYTRGGVMFPDGSRFALISGQSTVKVFSSYDGSLLKTYYGHNGWMNGITVSNDGTKLATASSDKTAKIWDVSGGYALRTFTDFTDHVLCVAFSPDGRYLAVSGYDKSIKIYDVGSGSLFRTLYKHTNNVWALKYSADGRYLLSGDDNGNIYLWNTSTWIAEKTAFHSGTIVHFAFTADGQKLITSSSGGSAKSWTFPGLTELKNFSHSDKVWMSAVSSDQKYLFTAGFDKVAKIWDLNTGSSLQTLGGHTNNVTVVLLTPDNQTLITASDDNTFKMWRVSGIGGGWQSSGSVVAASSGDEFDITLQKTISYQLSGDYNRGGAISPDGAVFAIGGKDGQLKLFNTSDGSVKSMLTGHSSWVNGLAFSADNTKLVSGCSDKTLKIWDVRGGYAIRTISGFSSDVIAVAYSPDGRWVAGGGFDKEVKIFNASTGELVKTLYGHNNSIWSLQFSPDGQYLVSGDSDGNIKVWSTAGWSLVKSAVQAGWITSIRFTSNSAKVVTTSYGNTVRIWTFPAMLELKTMYHTDKAWMAAISPDEKYVASSGADKVIRVWDMNTGTNVKTLYGHTNTVGVVLFSSDGKKMISASDDNTIRIWSVSGVGSKTTGVYVSTGTTGTARTLVVAKDGSGQYSSIASALAAAQSGDIVQVKAGTYYESNLKISKSGVKLTGEGPGKTIIDAGGQSPLIEVSNADNATISGFTFRNATGTGGGIRIRSSKITFSNNVVTDFKDYGLYIWDCDPVITNNIFYKTAGGEYADAKDAIGLNKSNAVIKNNIFYGNYGGSAIDNENSSYPTISYNIIHSSGQAFKRCYGGDGNSFSDPLLNTRDFTLQYGSPAIGKGEGGTNIGLVAALSSGTSTGTSTYSGSVNATISKTLYGHTSAVRGAAISPDGKIVASGDSKGTIILWDASTGYQLKTLSGHTSWINGISFSPDGRRLVTASSDKNVMVWDVQSGVRLMTLTGHTDLVLSARYSPDGQWIASCSFDNTVRIWNASSGFHFKTLTGHKNSVWSIAFNNEGTLLASGDTGDEIILWNTSSWNRIRSMKSGKSSNWVNGLVFSLDGKFLYAGNYDNTIIVWDVAAGTMQKTFSGHTNHVWGLALSPDGKILASASEDRTVKLWETATGNIVKTLNEPKEALFAVGFSMDGTKLVSGSDDKNVYVWNITGISGTTVTQVVNQAQQMLPPYLTASAVFSDANGDKLLSAGETGKITLTIKNTGKGPAQSVNARFTITAGLLGMYVGTPSVFVGEIPPGGEKTVSTTIDAGEDVIDQKVTVRVQATEKNGFDADAVVINFNTKASDPPLLSVSKYVLRDDGSGMSQGNGDGIIQKKETIELTLFITNAGNGAASNVRLNMKSGDPAVLVSQATADLGEIKPGETKKGVFVFAVSANYNDAVGGSELPLSMEITEKRAKFNRTEKLDLKLGADYRREVVVDVVSEGTTGGKTATGTTGTSTNIRDKVNTAVQRMNDEISRMTSRLGDVELPERQNVFAVVVGISDYKSRDIPPLQFAVNDAAGVYALLTNKILGGVPKSNVLFLKNEEAIYTELKAALGWLVNQGLDDEDVTLIFYYSGHGAPEQDDQGNVRTAYLIPYDGQPKFISETAISIDYLQQELSKVKAKNVFVALDACFTGSGRSFMKKGSRGINIVPKEIVKPQGEGRVFMTAAANDQSAFDLPEKQHGLFTSYLLEAMMGNADADENSGNNDGWITSTEIFNYVRDRVVKTARKIENTKQEPQMIGSGEIKLTRILKKEASSMTQEDKMAKLKKALNDGVINMNQYVKAAGQIKSGSESQLLKDYLSGKIDAKKFAESY